MASVDNEFIIENFIEYFKERKAYPKQLSLLIWRLRKADIDFNKSHFKLTIKKKREQENLLQLEDWKLKVFGNVYLVARKIRYRKERIV